MERPNLIQAIQIWNAHRFKYGTLYQLTGSEMDQHRFKYGTNLRTIQEQVFKNNHTRTSFFDLQSKAHRKGKFYDKTRKTKSFDRTAKAEIGH